jgi:predicted lipid-binding transport protein (Tim44 family)
MKRTSILAFAIFAATAFVGAEIAEAKRMGGGRTFGAQRQATPPAAAPNAAPTAPAAAPMQSAAAAKAAAPAAAATSGMSRWLGPIAGIAAGLGLAALMSHLGLSEAFGSFLLIALLAVAAVFLVRMFLGRKSQPARPMQYAGAGAGLGNTPGGYETQVPPKAPAGQPAFEPVFNGVSTPVAPVAASALPADFDPAPFIQQGKVQFRKLQAAYDQSDRQALSEVMTPEMFAEITQEIADRGTHVPTEVMQLDAEVLSASTEGDRHWMSIRFHGLLREDGTVLPKAFDEVWNLTKPVKGSSGWLLAGIQQADHA